MMLAIVMCQCYLRQLYLYTMLHYKGASSASVLCVCVVLQPLKDSPK